MLHFVWVVGGLLEVKDPSDLKTSGCWLTVSMKCWMVGGRVIVSREVLVSFLKGILKALKEDLMKWNKESFCNVSLRKSELLAELLMLDCVEENMGLLDSE